MIRSEVDVTVQAGSAILPGGRSGQGVPLVLLHGFGLDRSMWDPQISDFGTRHEVIRYDLRGFGGATLPTQEPYSHAGDLEAVLDTLGIDQAVIVGLSLGGNVALHFALTRPARTRALVLVSSSLPGFSWPDSEKRPREAAMDLGRTQGIAAARAFWRDHAMFAPARAIPSARTALDRMDAAYSGWHWLHQDPQSPMPNIHAQLAHIERPTLVVSGELDLPVYRAIGHHLGVALPQGRHIHLPHAGHLLTLEDAPTFNQAVLAFTASVAATPPRPVDRTERPA